MTRPSAPVPAHNVPSAVSTALRTCAGVVVSRFASCGPAVMTPLRFTYTPSDVPLRKSAAVAVVQKVGPEAPSDGATRAVSKTRSVSVRALDIEDDRSDSLAGREGQCQLAGTSDRHVQPLLPGADHAARYRRACGRRIRVEN